MGSKQIVTGMMGLAVGFILGYFVSQALERPAALEHTGEERSAGRMPQNHPSPEVIRQLQGLQTRAEANPKDVQTRIELGNRYYDMGRFDAAIRWYEEVMNLDPTNVDVNTDLGTAYLYTSNAPKGIQLYRRSLEMDPAHAQTLQNLGIAYFTIGRYPEAIEYWERLIEAHPEYPQAEEIKQQIEVARNHLRQGGS